MSKGALGLLSAYWPEGMPRYGHIPLQRVTRGCVHAPAESHPDTAALVAGGRRTSFAELSETTRRAAAAFRERLEPGARVAVTVSEPAALLGCALGALEADLQLWLHSGPAEAETLRRFEPALVVADPEAAGAVPDGAAVAAPEAILAGGTGEEPGGRPNLRRPALVLPRPGGGEVAHNHKTLLATGLALGGFFLFEPGSETALLDPPASWLPLAVMLGAWSKAGTVHAAWSRAGEEPEGRVDYAALRYETVVERFLRPGSTPYAGRIGVGAIVGVEAGLSAARRRRIARRLRTPVFTVFGRSDLGACLASHPTWFLEDSVGIPLPNVDLRPLDPSDGSELAIGWDSVEEAEMGIRSALAPAGGEVVGRWLRSRELAHVDPTGCYFPRRWLDRRS